MLFVHYFGPVHPCNIKVEGTIDLSDNIFSIINPLIMFAVFSALESMSTEESEGRAGLVMSAGDAFHLQLKVQLQRFCSGQVSQCSVSSERS